jgi:hypothetical protein
MCPQTPSLSPEYSHKTGLQAIITSMPLQIRPVTQRRPRRARYNGPDHTWASELNEAALRDGVAAGLRLVPNGAKGVPTRFVSVRPATAAKASSEGWRLCLRPNTPLSAPLGRSPSSPLSSFRSKRRGPRSLRYTVAAVTQTRLSRSRKTLAPLGIITTAHARAEGL